MWDRQPIRSQRRSSGCSALPQGSAKRDARAGTSKDAADLRLSTFAPLSSATVESQQLLEPGVDLEHDLSAAMRAAGKQLMRKRSLGKRQDLANVRLERAVREQRAKLVQCQPPHVHNEVMRLHMCCRGQCLVGRRYNGNQ